MAEETHIKVSGTWRLCEEIHIKVSGTWRSVDEVWLKVSGVWKQVFSSGFRRDYTIAGHAANWNWRSSLIADGWDQVKKVVSTVTINSGVVIYSPSVGSYAFNMGGSFPAGSDLTLVNNGYIRGKAGDGGQAGGYLNTLVQAPGLPGTAGGPALNLTAAVTVQNNGHIGGGGGGGGGGGAGTNFVWDNGDPKTPIIFYDWMGGGGGGGGAGDTQGGRGIRGFDYQSLGWPFSNPTPAGNAYSLLGQYGAYGGYHVSGAGGPRTYSPNDGAQYGGAGGAGGGLGSPGSPGESGTHDPQVSPTYTGTGTGTGGAGGAAGIAVQGNSHATWSPLGTVYGTRTG